MASLVLRFCGVVRRTWFGLVFRYGLVCGVCLCWVGLVCVPVLHALRATGCGVLLRDAVVCLVCRDVLWCNVQLCGVALGWWACENSCGLECCGVVGCTLAC